MNEVALLEFLHNAYRLKEIRRTGWKLRGIKNPESVAEHSFMLALMALALAKPLKLNAEKCISLALIHDLPEIITGDIAHAGIASKKQVANESKAMKKMLSKLDAKTKNTISGLWNEFALAKSKEAKIIQQLDNLECTLQAHKYEKSQNRRLQEFFDAAEERLTDKNLLGLLHALNNVRSR